MAFAALEVGSGSKGPLLYYVLRALSLFRRNGEALGTSTVGGTTLVSLDCPPCSFPAFVRLLWRFCLDNMVFLATYLGTIAVPGDLLRLS